MPIKHKFSNVSLTSETMLYYATHGNLKYLKVLNYYHLRFPVLSSSPQRQYEKYK